MAILTIAKLMAASEKTVPLPELSKDTGEDQVIRVRRVGRAEYLSLLPPLPPEAAEWPPEQFSAHELAWIRSLPPDQGEARRVALRDVLYRTLALAAVEPALTLEQARRLASDGELAAAEVLRFSGLLITPKGAGEEPKSAEAQEWRLSSK